jgi:hypothetical protein
MTDVHEATWHRPPDLCAECVPVVSDAAVDMDAAWLHCVLATGHQPPHFDHQHGIYWFKPGSGDTR